MSPCASWEVSGAATCRNVAWANFRSVKRMGWSCEECFFFSHFFVLLLLLLLLLSLSLSMLSLLLLLLLWFLAVVVSQNLCTTAS